eukprot:CAMPEP_0170209818 /NCGR_PEP_ID=MMETSP0116_2-20130129/4500_1 /TAXON_ID=400756 /ORGANISM="Durinskia baltica, Strain CSIRO CS-38" /LENGTH=51 /DNA_ID=CAMNT_0010460303 /DNA_START=308 /DNA_END=463 /DNA_ORIENTATION=+
MTSKWWIMDPGSAHLGSVLAALMCLDVARRIRRISLANVRQSPQQIDSEPM